MWYHGPGLAIERLHDQQQGSSQELQSLLSENAELRAEVQALQQLLEVWQPQACCICQLHASTNTSTSSSRGSSRLPAASAHAAIDRILRQQQVLIAQQQRQLLVLQVSPVTFVDTARRQLARCVPSDISCTPFLSLTQHASPPTPLPPSAFALFVSHMQCSLSWHVVSR